MLPSGEFLYNESQNFRKRRRRVRISYRLSLTIYLTSVGSSSLCVSGVHQSWPTPEPFVFYGKERNGIVQSICLSHLTGFPFLFHTLRNIHCFFLSDDNWKSRPFDEHRLLLLYAFFFYGRARTFPGISSPWRISLYDGKYFLRRMWRAE